MTESLSLPPALFPLSVGFLGKSTDLSNFEDYRKLNELVLTVADTVSLRKILLNHP